MFVDTRTLTQPTLPGVSGVTARVSNAGGASGAGRPNGQTLNLRERLAAAAGTKDPATLPHLHARCGARWSGSITAHCASCCETFTGVSTFDTHRDGRPGDNRYPAGQCYYPGDCGLVLLTGRAYRCWGTPPAPAEEVGDGR